MATWASQVRIILWFFDVLVRCQKIMVFRSHPDEPKKQKNIGPNTPGNIIHVNEGLLVLGSLGRPRVRPERRERRERKKPIGEFKQGRWKYWKDLRDLTRPRSRGPADFLQHWYWVSPLHLPVSASRVIAGIELFRPLHGTIFHTDGTLSCTFGFVYAVAAE